MRLHRAVMAWGLVLVMGCNGGTKDDPQSNNSNETIDNPDPDDSDVGRDTADSGTPQYPSGG